jgi:hypothetical protein
MVVYVASALLGVLLLGALGRAWPRLAVSAARGLRRRQLRTLLRDPLSDAQAFALHTSQIGQSEMLKQGFALLLQFAISCEGVLVMRARLLRQTRFWLLARDAESVLQRTYMEDLLDVLIDELSRGPLLLDPVFRQRLVLLRSAKLMCGERTCHVLRKDVPPATRTLEGRALPHPAGACCDFVGLLSLYVAERADDGEGASDGSPS